MRCPKCHYLSFEPEPRCRNCGYDLSLGSEDVVSKPLDRGDRPLADFDLRAPDAPAKPVERPLNRISLAPRVEPTDLVMRWPSEERENRVSATDKPAPARHAPRRPASELPLFLREIPDRQPQQAEPLVKLSAEPRPPLSVRRNTPLPGRVKEKYEQRPEIAAPRQVGLLERDPIEPARPAALPPAAPVAAPQSESQARDVRPQPTPAVSVRPVQRAGTLRRLEAAFIDILFIGVIDIAMVLLILQRCNLSVLEIGTLPIWPVAAFLLVIDAGYLLMFTATTGQTVGKMAAGIRVIDTDSTFPGHDRVTVGHAFLRALLTFPSVLVLGAGFLPAFLGEHRAVHDRLTHTRVVRV